MADQQPSEIVGGTKLNKKAKQNMAPPPQQMQQSPPPNYSQPPPQQMQQGPPPGYGPPPPPQQMQQGPPPGYARPVLPSPPSSRPRGEQVVIPEKSSFKSKFSSSSGTNNAFLVAVLFLILNSKIVWRQLMKLPFMGAVEPSMIALIVNSILAGIVFFIITKFIMKN
jgi:hypothetical protein